jgi:hypothetical protein
VLYISIQTATQRARTAERSAAHPKPVSNLQTGRGTAQPQRSPHFQPTAQSYGLTQVEFNKFDTLMFVHFFRVHAHTSPVQHRSLIGLSQLLLAFTTLEQAVGSVASSHSQLVCLAGLRLRATACYSCERLAATGPTACSRSQCLFLL